MLRPLATRGSNASASSPTVPSPSLPLLAQVDHLAISKDETLEIVDFTEHGKLIGVVEEEELAAVPLPNTNGSSRRPPRPVATDFFHDYQETHALSPIDGNRTSWRRRSSAASEPPRALLATQELDVRSQEAEPSRDLPRLQIAQLPPESSPTQPQTRHPLPLDDNAPHLTQHGHGESAHALKSPQAHAYREAPMSALNDTMARIKGALDGMHKPEPKQRWLPPALRAKGGEQLDSPHENIRKPASHGEHQHVEVFDVTGIEPPRSPKPAWNHFMVRFPRASRAMEAMSPKRLRFFATQRYMRLDICSIGPSNDNLNRRNLQQNELLFPRPPFFKGRPKYEVRLPRSDVPAAKVFTSLPVVKLPAKSGNAQAPSQGAFGRAREADGAPSWRRPPSSPLRPLQKDLLEPPPGGLDTISRSPPPETPTATNQAYRQDDSVLSPPVIIVPPSKAKIQPQASEIPAVGFYRDSPIDAAPVKFIVNSELEDDAKRSPDASTQLGAVPTQRSLSTFPTLSTMSIQTPPNDPPLRPEPISSSKDPIVEFRKGNRSVSL